MRFKLYTVLLALAGILSVAGPAMASHSGSHHSHHHGHSHGHKHHSG